MQFDKTTQEIERSYLSSKQSHVLREAIESKPNNSSEWTEPQGQRYNPIKRSIKPREIWVNLFLHYFVRNQASPVSYFQECVTSSNTSALRKTLHKYNREYMSKNYLGYWKRKQFLFREKVNKSSKTGLIMQQEYKWKLKLALVCLSSYYVHCLGTDHRANLEHDLKEILDIWLWWWCRGLNAITHDLSWSKILWGLLFFLPLWGFVYTGIQ